MTSACRLGASGSEAASAFISTHPLPCKHKVLLPASSSCASLCGLASCSLATCLQSAMRAHINNKFHNTGGKDVCLPNCLQRQQHVTHSATLMAGVACHSEAHRNKACMHTYIHTYIHTYVHTHCNVILRCVMSCHVMSCHVMSCHVRSGQVRSGQVRSGQVRSGQVRSGQVRYIWMHACVYIYICIYTYIHIHYIYIYMYIYIYKYTYIYIYVYIVVPIHVVSNLKSGNKTRSRRRAHGLVHSASTLCANCEAS